MRKDLDKYFPYLSEVKRRLFLTAAVFIAASIFGFFYYEKIINLALTIFKLEGVNIVFTSPFQFLELSINSGLLVGIIIILPLLIWQILSFLRPALTGSEFKLILGLLPLSLILFITGFSFGVLIMKNVIEIFYVKSVELEIGNFLDVTKLLTQVLVTSSLMGLAFQFPLILTVLMRFGILKVEVVESQRILAWGASIVFAAFLPPTDILSLVFLAAPLVILYELTLILNKRFFKPHKRR